MQDFVHLHVHTQYSILDGQASIPRLVDKAMANGMRGIAVTDHGDMFGIKEFFNYVNKKNGGTNGEIKDLKKKIAALESGKEESENPEAEIAACKEQLEAAKKKLFKPIFGCEMYVARRRLEDKEGKPDQSGYHLVVLAKNLKGYHNLIKLVSKAWTRILHASAYRPCGIGEVSRRTDCMLGLFGRKCPDVLRPDSLKRLKKPSVGTRIFSEMTTTWSCSATKRRWHVPIMRCIPCSRW